MSAIDRYRKTLNPIACDNCRSKKCRCDRRVYVPLDLASCDLLTPRRPSCSQCRASALICRYQEGGKRGLPIAYINNLEKRLRETESALYAAMVALDEHESIQSSNFGILKAPRELSKIERQDDWQRLPLQTPEQLATWYREKQHQAVPPEPELPHISFPGIPTPQPVDSASVEDSRITLPVPHTPSSDNVHSPAYPESVASALSKDVAKQLKDIEPPQAPNASRPFGSTSWHNYF